MRYTEENAMKIDKTKPKAVPWNDLSAVNQRRKRWNMASQIVVILLLLSSLVCFFVPFVTVSLELPDIPFVSIPQEEAEITASGFELATGWFKDETVDTVNGILGTFQEYFNSGEGVTEIPLNICTTIAMALTLMALFLAIHKKTSRIPVAVVSVLAAASLIVFQYTFISYYRLDTEIGPFNLIFTEIGPFQIDSFLEITQYNIVRVLAGLDILAAGLALIKIKPKKTPIKVVKAVASAVESPEEKSQNSLGE